jgi:hypothetical protein
VSVAAALLLRGDGQIIEDWTAQACEWRHKTAKMAVSSPANDARCRK